MPNINIITLIGNTDENGIAILIDECNCVASGTVIKTTTSFVSTPDTCEGATVEGVVQLTNVSTGEVIINDTISETIGAQYDYTSAEVTLTKPGTYELIVSVVICGETFAVNRTFTVCQAATIESLSCGKYRFTNNTGNAVTFSVETIGGTYVKQDITVEAGAYYDFTLTDAGIYLAGYYWTDPDTSRIQVFNIQINFFCTIEACLTKLITQVLCAAEEDPCCKECNDEAKKKGEALRYELNKLMALYGYYLAINFYSKITYLNTPSLTTQMLADLTDLNNVIEKIIKLTASCGPAKCQEDSVTVVNCGC